MQFFEVLQDASRRPGLLSASMLGFHVRAGCKVSAPKMGRKGQKKEERREGGRKGRKRRRGEEGVNGLPGCAGTRVLYYCLPLPCYRGPTQKLEEWGTC